MVVDPAVVNAAEAENEENMEPESQESEQDQYEADYKRLLSNGKKSLLCGDHTEAVACFEAACSIQSERFGDTSHECAESFLYYGKALLELAKVENGVLGNALKGVPETEDSNGEEEEQFEKTKDVPVDQREQLRQEVEAAMATETEDTQDENEENPDEDKTDAEKDIPEGQKEMTTQEKETSEEVSSKSSEEQESEPAPECSSSVAGPSTSKASDGKTEGENIDNPDDVPNMQLAWEMLELAKVLYKKKPQTKENKLLVAECHAKLGDLSLEIENYSEAVGDFLECLLLRKDLLKPDDRELAETHYNLGLVYSHDMRHVNALEHFNSTLKALQLRIDNLNALIEINDGDPDKDKETMDACVEVGQIRSLFPEINAKIEDVMTLKKEEELVFPSPFQKPTSSSTAFAGETSTGFAAATSSGSSIRSPVCTVIPIRKGSADTAGPSTNDISHLVRRKRSTPDEPSTSQTESENKKAKQELNDASGDVTNGHSNGDAAVKSANLPETKEAEPKTVTKVKDANKESSSGAAEVLMET
ncbi:protein HGV2-like isoform X1 [Clavelina lepadiformis]|uniref:protein HGV2-like isoform X1 n=1 Tax=Clavelina lepadiformis TaxID=159417 RepID=UPI0040424529